MDVELDLPLLVRSNRSVLRIVGVVLTEFKTRGASDPECSYMLSRKTPMICISEFAEAYSNVAYINEVRLPVRGGYPIGRLAPMLRMPRQGIQLR